MDYKATIKPFILSNFLFTDDSGAVADDTSLIRGGIVDSTGILELIEFLESAYDIRVSPEEMVPANFDSIDSISTFLGRKAAGGVQ
ncbi:acyl carrier protein [Luteimonas sp. MJ174]|uniref:acyl carrier protein n=1 Tax=Luteimonas sp. MJ174 TaxID=3129237 RepID=UPI0031BB8AB4